MVLVCPVLHRRHHERFGADHTHSALGVHALLHAASTAQSRAHEDFDDDLAALGLADVALAGTLAIDCETAEYTLTACDPSRVNHPANFGDELLARTAHSTPARSDFDPEHGKGSPEHLSLSLLAGRVVLFTPPVRVASRTEVPALFDVVATRPLPAHAARGPPPRA